MKRSARLILLAGLAAVACGAFAADTKVLTAANGMTLYIFDKDLPGKSNCNGNCAAVWPPVAVEAVAAGTEIGAIGRDDGSKQATFQGKPLYLYAADQKPGDRLGDGSGNVWHALSPGGEAAPAAANKQTGYSSGDYY
jgi:predicted lipoprotein with Yx(FWY)xxD motif